jgi:HSP20 family protein
MDDIFTSPMLPMLSHRFRPRFDLPSEGAILPVADLHELPDKYIIETEMPGVLREDVKFNLADDHTIVVRGEVKRHGEGDRSGERYFGLLERAFTVPARIEPDKIQAELKDGILKLEIAKHEEEKKPLQISWKKEE